MKKLLVLIIFILLLPSCIVDGGVSDCPSKHQDMQLQENEIIVSIVPTVVCYDAIIFKYYIEINTVTIYNQKERKYYSRIYSMNGKTCTVEEVGKEHSSVDLLLHPNTIYQNSK